MEITSPKKFEYSVEEIVSLIETEIKKASKKEVREDGYVHVFIDSTFKSQEVMNEVEKTYLKQGWKEVKIALSVDSPVYSIYLIN